MSGIVCVCVHSCFLFWELLSLKSWSRLIWRETAAATQGLVENTQLKYSTKEKVFLCFSLYVFLMMEDTQEIKKFRIKIRCLSTQIVVNQGKQKNNLVSSDFKTLHGHNRTFIQL